MFEKIKRRLQMLLVGLSVICMAVLIFTIFRCLVRPQVKVEADELQNVMVIIQQRQVLDKRAASQI